MSLESDRVWPSLNESDLTGLTWFVGSWYLLLSYTPICHITSNVYLIGSYYSYSVYWSYCVYSGVVIVGAPLTSQAWGTLEVTSSPRCFCTTLPQDIALDCTRAIASGSCPEKLPGKQSGKQSSGSCSGKLLWGRLLITFLHQIFLCQEFLLY